LKTVAIPQVFALALQHHQMGRLEEAEMLYGRILAVQPDHAEALHHLGLIAYQTRRHELAVEQIGKAITVAPDNPAAHSNLGEVYRSMGRLDEAIASFRSALRLKPNQPEIYNNLGLALAAVGEGDAAIEAYRRALAIKPDYAAVHSSLIYTLHLQPRADDGAILEEQRRWNRQFGEPLQPVARAHLNDRSPDRRLRIGYVSSDFRFHALAFFFAPLIEAHDREQFEIYCYTSFPRPDAITDRLRKSAAVWQEVSELSETQLAERVRDDRIDVLVDLAMHTAGNRLCAFARKPAPVQVSWLAYPGSTGLEAIDYRLTDAHIDPLDCEQAGLGGEAVRLPDSWCCYAPIAEFPPASPLPAAQTGMATFGSLNQFGKLNEDLFRSWAALLGMLPGSRLLMICPEGQAQERTHHFFEAHGIARDRVELVAPRPWPEYLRLFQRIDLALDSFPCNGLTTTCHSLWMGVPVISRMGSSAVSRAGGSLLDTIGLPEWVAANEEEYLRLAVRWARDFSRLAELRSTLRTRMEASPLMDAPRFARNVESAYRSMWRRWCEEGRG